MIKRWFVQVFYENRFLNNSFYIEELEELQDIIEVGPDFATIKEIIITYNLKD